LMRDTPLMFRKIIKLELLKWVVAMQEIEMKNGNLSDHCLYASIF
jgi:hypothetical protein